MRTWCAARAHRPASALRSSSSCSCAAPRACSSILRQSDRSRPASSSRRDAARRRRNHAQAAAKTTAGKTLHRLCPNTSSPALNAFHVACCEPGGNSWYSQLSYIPLRVGGYRADDRAQLGRDEPRAVGPCSTSSGAGRPARMAASISCSSRPTAPTRTGSGIPAAASAASSPRRRSAAPRGAARRVPSRTAATHTGSSGRAPSAAALPRGRTTRCRRVPAGRPWSPATRARRSRARGRGRHAGNGRPRARRRARGTARPERDTEARPPSRRATR